jgi:hypothetical protein
VYKSWLKATPTAIVNQLHELINFHNNGRERHLAAIFEHFKRARNDALGQNMSILK